VDGCGREVLVDQEVGQGVCHALGLHEDEGETGTMSVEDVKQNGALVHILDVLDLLSDVLGGGTNTSNRQEDVVLQEISGEHLDVAGEGGRKHESLTALDTGHILALDDSSDLRLETHVQHTISLIEDQVLDVAQGDAATLDQIDETARGGNEEIATTLDLAELRTNVGTTVDNTWANPRSVSELARFLVDLRNKLTGRCEDQRGRVRLALTSEVSSSASARRSRWAGLEGLRQDREQETTGLSRTSLGTSHQITAAHDDGDGVLLDRSWDLVVSELNVLQQVVVKRGVGEPKDGLGDIVSRGLDRDIIVLLEVDTGLLLGGIIQNTEELALHTGVGGSGDVLAVSPLSITATASRAAAAGATGSGVSVGVLVEAAALGGAIPTWATTGGATTRGEVGSSGIRPVATGRRAVNWEAGGSVGKES
jgi:hypothetical protein